MTQLIRLTLFSIFLISSVACSNEAVNDEEVHELVMAYKKEQYTIEDPSAPPSEFEISENVSHYLSEDALYEQNINRIFDIAHKVAKKLNKKIELVDVVLVKGEEDENSNIDYDYTIKLKIGTDEIIEVNGHVTISNDNGLKIMSDFDHFRHIGARFMNK
ncbi:hypothetical protein [Cytobacillus sp. IB215316]|uniref:hypothetical protein n=1 Tax=Cytobacillus sp. IB215316 TaxID=3097354 RepID=UPI002A13ACA7|nr:hypothetical protein [Cytobacillus sp. IB215316]MDX8363170.1 hypothetical protein [Cytobacillus sp. IB215316]